MPNGITAIEISAHGQRDDRRQHVQRLVDVWRDQVFFEDEFDAVRQRLQQSERPHAAGSPAVLDAPHHLALQQHRIGHGR